MAVVIDDVECATAEHYIPVDNNDLRWWSIEIEWFFVVPCVSVQKDLIDCMFAANPLPINKVVWTDITSFNISFGATYLIILKRYAYNQEFL